MAKLAVVEKVILNTFPTFNLAFYHNGDKMILDEAKKIAENFLLEKMPFSAKGGKFLIVHDGIVENDEGWYFPYQTEEFIETRDMRKSVVGNSPIFVDRMGHVGFRMFGASFHPPE